MSIISKLGNAVLVELIKIIAILASQTQQTALSVMTNTIPRTVHALPARNSYLGALTVTVKMPVQYASNRLIC